MDIGLVSGGSDHVVEDRTLGHLGQLLHERIVGLEVAGGLGDLNRSLVPLGQHLGQAEDVLVTHGVGHHRGAVEVGLDRVGPQPLYGESGQAGLHALVHQALHLFALLIGGRPRFGCFEAHHVGHQRRRRHVLDDVDALRSAIQRVQVLGDGLPVPVHPLTHRLIRDGLGPGHREHRPVPEVGRARCETESAIAEHDRRDPVPTGNGAPRIPADLGVVVGVTVHESRSDDFPGGVDYPVGDPFGPPADLRDMTVLDPEVPAPPRPAAAVDDRSSRNVNVISFHRFPPHLVVHRAERLPRRQLTSPCSTQILLRQNNPLPESRRCFDRRCGLAAPKRRLAPLGGQQTVGRGATDLFRGLLAPGPCA